MYSMYKHVSIEPWGTYSEVDTYYRRSYPHVYTTLWLINHFGRFLYRGLIKNNLRKIFSLSFPISSRNRFQQWLLLNFFSHFCSVQQAFSQLTSSIPIISTKLYFTHFLEDTLVVQMGKESGKVNAQSRILLKKSSIQVVRFSQTLKQPTTSIAAEIQPSV